MITVNCRGRALSIPACIDELSPEQYLYYLKAISALSAGVIDLAYFRIRWLSYLCGMERFDYVQLKPEYVAEMDAQIDAALAGYFHKVDGELMPIATTCRNLLPVYNDHAGPGDWLDGMTYGKAVECLTAYEAVAKKDGAAEEAATHIARVMYGYNADEVIDPLLVQHSLLLFGSVWNAIQTAPVEINGRMIDFSIIFKPSSTGRRADDNTGWAGITFELASAGIFGPVKGVEDAGLWEVLLYLYKCKFESTHNNTDK